MKQQNTEIKNALATDPGDIEAMPCIKGQGIHPGQSGESMLTALVAVLSVD